MLACTTTALRLLGQRVLMLDAQLARLETALAWRVASAAPRLLEVFGVGIDSAATLLVTAGDNPARIKSGAAWAHLCEVAPIKASSGKVTRVRLDRGGDRHANSALWVVVITCIRNDERTKAYDERRLKEGKSKPEIIRVLERYVAREVYRCLPRNS